MCYRQDRAEVCGTTHRTCRSRKKMSESFSSLPWQTTSIKFTYYKIYLLQNIYGTSKKTFSEACKERAQLMLT